MEPETDKRRPMIFSHDKAFQQLRDKGLVWTCRKHRKKRGPVWIRRSRTGPKEFDAEIREWATVKNDGVKISVNSKGPFSGFDTAREWLDAIRENNDGELPDKATFHLVVREDIDTSEVYGNEFVKTYDYVECKKCGEEVPRQDTKVTIPGLQRERRCSECRGEDS